jgi:hypothetical protein
VDVRVDGSRRGSTRIGADPRADCGPAADGAEHGILGGNSFVTLFILLEEESNGDTVRQMEKRRSGGEFPVVFIETDVAEFEEFCTVFTGD